jgi:hypothetical protein
MSKVTPDISMSLDGLITQPENGPGGDPWVFLFVGAELRAGRLESTHV